MMIEDTNSPTLHSLRLAEIAQNPTCANSQEMEIIQNDPDLKRQYERMKDNPLQISYVGMESSVIRGETMEMRFP